jgi:glycosyltransferase involved in cell wall biosynthesis
MLDRVAPSAARRLRDVWYTINGGRAETLGGLVHEQMHSLRQQLVVGQASHQEHLDAGLRPLQMGVAGLQAQQDAGLRQLQLGFAGLQAQQEAARTELDAFRTEMSRVTSRIEESGGTGAAFILQDSLRRLEAADRSAAPRIAVVSVLPPMETGIADYTLHTFEVSPVAVDVFAPFPDAGAYLAAAHRLRRPDGPLTIHALEALSFALATRRYRAVIWVMGNSAHHLPVLRLMRETRHLAPLAPHWVQLHDPMLFHLTQLYVGQIGRNLAPLLRAAAVADIPHADWAAVARGDVATLLDHPGLPARALFNDVPLRGVVLHSRAARDVLRRGWPEIEALEQRRLYLPVLDPFTQRTAPPESPLRIGSFGYPAASKGTDAILAAFRHLRGHRPEATLVIAGYNAARYAQEEKLCDEPGLELHDNPSMPRLHALMDSVDVAVQLRTHNSGESSGIIPQLLSRDVPTLTSAIGAFGEYGEAVRTIAPNVGTVELGVAILDEASQPARRRAARRAYVEQRGPGQFCAALLCDTATEAAPALLRD